MLELSQTDLKSYMRCKQYFKYTWTLGRQPKTVPLRVIEGASVHSGLAKLAAGQGPPSGDLIADNYVIHHPLPKVIKSIEEPMFWEYEDFRIRFTPDLLYHNDTNSLVCRDYKTFSRMPSFAPDVDFQCRIYLALSHADYWEYVYIRNVVPGTKKSNGIWKPEECYFTEKVFTDERQRATTLQELRYLLADIRKTVEEGSYYRQPQKGFGGCESCWMKELCVQEYHIGPLSSNQVAFYTDPRGER